MIVLGTAAGGGSPQWNCACRVCALVRAGAPGTVPRTHDCLAVTGDRRSWYLINAGPDLAAQIARHGQLCAGPDCRVTPVRGVLLTDAEIDHIAGLLLLRQAIHFEVFGTDAILRALEDSIRRVLDSYTAITWARLRSTDPLSLPGDIEVTALPVSGKLPRYVRRPRGGVGVVGYRLRNRATQRSFVYLPGLARWGDDLEEHVRSADVVLVDGTFWSDDELVRTGVSDRSATSLGHLPIAGANGSAEALARLEGVRRLYTHVNNTNPALIADSAERRYLAERGLEVAADGMEFEL